MSREQRWIDAMKEKGHSPKLDGNGDLDAFVLDADFHNGPGCAICGDAWCWNCTDPNEIEPCDVIEGDLRAEKKLTDGRPFPSASDVVKASAAIAEIGFSSDDFIAMGKAFNRMAP